MSRFAKPLAGLGRTLGRTAAGLTFDLASGAARLGEVAADSVAGRRRDPGVLRVQVIILSDEQGKPLVSADQVRPALEAADLTLTKQAGVRVRVVGIRTVTEVPPPAALDPRANRALLLDDVLGRTEFYREHLHDAPEARGFPALIGAPITVVVVRNIAGNTTGCSLGMSADWVITQAALYDRNNDNSYDETVLAHELGHAVNLPHHRDRGNLMFPESSPPHHVRGNALTGWQRSVIQANRHVVPGRSVDGPDLG